MVHRGGHAVAARAPDRVHVTIKVPVVFSSYERERERVSEDVLWTYM